MRKTLLLSLPLLLAGCDMHGNPATKDGQDVHISVAQNDSGGGAQVALNIPGLDGKFSIPAFFMKNGHMDIDGLTLAPDTSVKSVDVLGQDKGDGKDGDGSIHMTFTNPKGPAELAAYYRRAAENASFTISPISGDSGIIATKARKRVTISLSGENSGTRGAIDVSEKGDS